MSSTAPRDLMRTIERTEIEVFEDLYRGASGDGRGGGLALERVAGAALLMVNGLDDVESHRVVGLGLDEPATPAAVDAVLERIAATGAPRFEVTVCPEARPPELARWLEERGLEPGAPWAQLTRDVGPVTRPATTMRVESVDHHRAADFRRVMGEAFGLPDHVVQLFTSRFRSARWSHYMALEGDRPVAVARLYVHGEIAYLGTAATLERHRGRGAHRALIARRIDDARIMGARRLVAQIAAHDPERPAASYRNLTALGFELAYLRPAYRWRRPA